MDDFIFTYDYRWIGNYVLSALGLIVLFYFAGRRERPAWLAGAAIFAALFALLFAAAVIYDINHPRNGSMIHFRGHRMLAWFSALPIQGPCNVLLGAGNFVEEHLMIPTALMVWGTVGAAVGAVGARLVRRSGRGG